MKSFAFNFSGSEEENRSLSATFSFEPENVYEKKSGNLYMVGLLANSLPQDQSFLTDLALQIKKSHYDSPHKTVERSLNDSLQDTNAYLEKMIKCGRVGWMGNLNFAVFALRNRDFLFAKTGAISILLLRDGTVIDLDQDLKNSPEQTNSQVFGNLVTGKLQDGDAILASTAGIGAFLKKQKMVKEIATIVAGDNQNFDISRLEGIFEANKIKMTSLEGSCLLISLRADISEGAVLDFKSDDSIKKVSLREMFASQRSKIPAAKMPRVSFGRNRGSSWAKLAVGALLLIALIAGGYLFYSVRLAQAVAGAKTEIRSIADRISTIDSLKASGNGDQARNLLASSVAELETIKKTAAPFLPQINSQISQVQASIDSATLSLNGSQIVSPVGVFRFTDFFPKRIAMIGNEILAFDPKSKGIYSISDGKSKYIDFSQGFDLCATSQNSAVFFAKPDQIAEYKDGNFSQAVKLGLPYSNAAYDDLGIYSDNLYFVDRNAGTLIKYLRLGKGYSLPQNWLAGGLKIASNEISLAFDRNAWVLHRDGSIDEYFAGSLENSFKPSYLPPPQDVTKILTSNDLQNLYILDSTSGRIIILSKTGQLMKQLVSDQLKGALDFAVSGNGNKILILTPDQIIGIDQ